MKVYINLDMRHQPRYPLAAEQKSPPKPPALLGLLAVLAFFAIPSPAYVFNIPDGPKLHRTDFGNIQFLANQNIAAGLMTSDGKLWITADSLPMDAIAGALATWNGVSTSSARFAAIQTTALSHTPQDGKHVIAFTDDEYARSFGSGVLAYTLSQFTVDGTVTDSDIVFSPYVQFSTTGAVGTYDLQSVLTHELGHSLGANHSNILSATMFQATAQQDFHQRNLGADDAAFVSALYPAAGGNGYGTIAGNLTLNGGPLRGGLLTAIDPSTGITVGGFSSVSDGSYSFQVPPGNYYVYAEPLGRVVQPGDLNFVNSITVVDTSFQAIFAGGNSQPSTVAVRSGTTAILNLTAAPGVSGIKSPYTHLATAGALGDYRGQVSIGSSTTSSGQSVDLIFSDSGLGLNESNVQVYGAAKLRAGSLRKDSIILGDGTAFYRFTLDIPPLAANGAATIVFRNGNDILTLTGLLNLTRPQSVNAGSFLGGAVAPGEILSFFGSQLGPQTPLSNGGFDGTGKLPGALGDITVTFDKTAAPLFYVSGGQINLQVPYEVAGQPYTLMTVSYLGTVAAKTTLTVAKSAPGIFVVTNANGSANTQAAPSPIGGIVVLYGTGSGIGSVAAVTGAASPSESKVPALVTLSGKSVPPIYAGLTAGSIGLMQVNVAIPDGTPSGTSVPVQVSINGSESQTVFVWVR